MSPREGGGRISEARLPNFIVRRRIVIPGLTRNPLSRLTDQSICPWSIHPYMLGGICLANFYYSSTDLSLSLLAPQLSWDVPLARRSRCAARVVGSTIA